MNFVIIVIGLSCFLGKCAGFTPCILGESLQGRWGIWSSNDDVTYQHQYDVTINYDTLSSFYLTTFPTLMYYCYDLDGSTVAFGSVETKLFIDYTVRVYFCWHLVAVNSETYYIVDRTNPIYSGSEEHGKAFLVNGTEATVNTVCEVAYNPESGLSPPYKQLRKVVTLGWT